MAKDQAKNQTPTTDEIATTQKDLDIFTGWLNRYENPDPVLRTESGGKGLKLYDEVARDPHSASVLQTRYLSVAGKEWEILPADESESSKKIADFNKTCLENIDFTQTCQELLQAVLYGFYVSEIMWAINGGNIIPSKIMGKHPRRFSFTMDRELRLLTPQDMVEGEPVPDRKFIVFSYGSSDNPYGQGLGQKLWWPVWFKKNGIKFWLVFLEKFGMPTTVGKYPEGTSPEQQAKLLNALDAIQNESAVKIPATMSIDLLEASRAGKVSYESLCDYMDRQISKAVLGQTLTTEVKGEGSYAASKTHDNVRKDILKADADILCETLNATLIKWATDYNFPNVTAYPKLWIRTEPEEDLKELAERDKIIVKDIGVPVGRRYFYDTYAIPEPEEGEEIVEPGGRGSGEPGNRKNGEFAESSGDLSPTDTLDTLGEKTLAGANMDELINPIKKLLDSSASLEEFRDRLIDVYGDMPVSELGNFMQRALTLADLSGRFDAQER